MRKIWTKDRNKNFTFNKKLVKKQIMTILQFLTFVDQAENLWHIKVKSIRELLFSDFE